MGNCPATRASERRLFLSLALCCTMALGAAAQETPAYRNPSLPVEQRVGDLLPRMTLKEKVAQLLSTWQNPDSKEDQSQMFVDEKGVFSSRPRRRSVETRLG
jgi:hypothetical protein